MLCYHLANVFEGNYSSKGYNSKKVPLDVQGIVRDNVDAIMARGNPEGGLTGYTGALPRPKDPGCERLLETVAFCKT